MAWKVSGPRGLAVGKDWDAGQWKVSVGLCGQDGPGKAAVMKSLAAKRKGTGGKTEDRKTTGGVDLFPVAPSTARPRDLATNQVDKTIFPPERASEGLAKVRKWVRKSLGLTGLRR